MVNKWLNAAGLMVVAILASCAEGRRPLVMAEVCVRDAHDRTSLVAVLRNLGEARGMDFYDRSQEVEKELRRIEGDLRRDDSQNPITMISMRRRDGLGVSFSSVGVNTSQSIVLGFSAGRDERESIAFANDTIAILSERWAVHRLPPGRGATGDICAA